MLSVGQKLDQNKGVGPGFDFLRIALSVAVVAWHSASICRDKTTLDDEPYVWLFGYSILFSFFALSGFLIAASALRLRLRDFLINRSLRIFPALAVEITLSAFVLGALVTTESAKSYFTSPTTYRYLTNIIGLINYRLPGVFEANPVQLVNLSLWTVPFEIACYAIMSCFIVFGLLRRPAVVVTLILIFMASGLFLKVVNEDLSGIAHEASRIATGRGSRLFVAFVFGILVYLLRYKIPYARAIAIVSVTWCAATSIIASPGLANFPLLNALLGLPVAYLTVYIGTSDVPLPRFLHLNDLSYGVYLYGMPIQQAMVLMFPSITGPIGQFFLSISVILPFAWASWKVIERPITRLRRKFSFVAGIRGATGRQEAQVIREVGSELR
jgi:peptidoglycan/LPS O-acetylase OafA/YrhL